METRDIVEIICAIIGAIAVVAAAVIGVAWGKSNFTVVVQKDGQEVELDDSGVHDMANENEELKAEIVGYEKKISDLQTEYDKQLEEMEVKNSELEEKLGIAEGDLDNAPEIKYENFGLSIDGEEKKVNKDRSYVSIDGREYYSKDFLENLLPEDRNTTQKGDILYVGKVIKEKSNLFDRQVIEKDDYISILENEKDTYGNMHNNVVVFEGGNRSITYNANREYSKLKCILTVKDGRDGGGVIQIESEKEILYTSEEILSTTEPMIVDIPINEASSITIRQISDEWTYNMVTDAVLYNEE